MVFTLWVTISFIIVIVSVCAFGYLAGVNPIPEGDLGVIMGMWFMITMVVAIAWPLILALAIITSPGWITYLIGRKVRKRA